MEHYKNAFAGSAPTTFATQEAFYDSFKDPMRLYTGGGVYDYGINIIDIFQFDYLPVQPLQIFP